MIDDKLRQYMAMKDKRKRKGGTGTRDGLPLPVGEPPISVLGKFGEIDRVVGAGPGPR